MEAIEAIVEDWNVASRTMSNRTDCANALTEGWHTGGLIHIHNIKHAFTHHPTAECDQSVCLSVHLFTVARRAHAVVQI